MPLVAPPRSTASVPVGLMCCDQSIDLTPAYSASGVAASKVPSGNRIRLAVRDHRHARYAVSNEPSNCTPSLNSRHCVAPHSRNSAAVRSATPGGQEAKNCISGFAESEFHTEFTESTESEKIQRKMACSPCSP